MTKKIIAVAGATGAQGGGLVRSILADPNGEFTVRAITRDPDSPKARALAAAGADVVAADIADMAAVARAFDGAYGAYCVTFFWNHFSPEQERAAREVMAKLAAEKLWAAPMVTEVVPASTFWRAENYHQEYFARVGSQNPYCTFVVEPKVAKFRKHFTDRLKKR